MVKNVKLKMDDELELDVNMSEMDLEITEMMRMLRMPRMREAYMLMVGSDELAKLSSSEVLHRLLSEQLSRRMENATAKRIKLSNIWEPEARLALLPEHSIMVKANELNQYAKFNFMNAGVPLKIFVGDQYERNYLASAFGAQACIDRIKTFYIKFEHLIDPDLRTEFERDTVTIDMLRDIPMLIIDDWLCCKADEKNTQILKSILEYRSTPGKGTILATCYREEAWEHNLTGPANAIRTFKRWFKNGISMEVKGAEAIQPEVMA